MVGNLGREHQSLCHEMVEITATTAIMRDLNGDLYWSPRNNQL